jgi:DNA-binding CsgD family transcriptional regulator
MSSDSKPEDCTVQYPFGITAREARVLDLVHHRERDIAAMLGISRGTVHVHMRQIREKLGAENKTQAALIWNQRKAA